MTGVQCSNVSSDILCKVADLDKAAGKGWEMGMERKVMEKQRERERENDENDRMTVSW
jgi:hypothetical protein